MEKNGSTSFIGIIPENYDRYLGTLFFENYAIDIVERIKHMKPQSILELACGTERVTKHISIYFPTSKIYATDLNPDMFDIAKKKVINDNINNIEWKIVDMQEIPFEDNYFDLIVCQFGIMFVTDKQKAFKEMYRVLKPGGILIFNSWDKLENNSVAYITHETVNTFFKNDPVTFYLVPFSYNDKIEIGSNLQEAGFKDINISLVKYEGSNETIDDATTGLVEGSPIYNSIMEKNQDLLPEIKQSVRKALMKKFGEKNPKFPLQAWVSTAKKS